MFVKILLIFPPWFNPTQPYLGLFELKAVLRSVKSWEIDIFDWSIESYQNLLTSGFLREAARMRNLKVPSVVNSIENILTRLSRSNEVYRDAVQTIDEVFDWYAFAFPSLRLWRYCGVEAIGWSLSSSTDIIRFASQEDYNIFAFLYQQLVEPRLRAGHYNIVGVSLVCPDQLPAVTTLALRLRRRYSNIRLVLGGPLASMLAYKRPKPAFLNLFDSVYIGAACEDVISAFSTDTYTISKPQTLIPDWPAADWQGIDLNRYLAPAPVLPVRASAGCSFQCKFCSSPAVAEKVEGKRFRFRGGVPIAEEIKSHICHNRASRFFLVGEMLTWSNARAIARSLREMGLGSEMGWYFWSRVGPRPPDGLLHLLVEAGCRRICFGLETLDIKALQIANKGVSLDEAEHTLRSVVAAGIQPHLFLMTGLPGQDFNISDTRIEALISELVDLGGRGLTVTISPYEPQVWSPWGLGDYELSQGECQPELQDSDLLISRPPSAVALARASELHKRISQRLLHLPYLGDFGNVHQLVFSESQIERANGRTA